MTMIAKIKDKCKREYHIKRKVRARDQVNEEAGEHEWLIGCQEIMELCSVIGLVFVIIQSKRGAPFCGQEEHPNGLAKGSFRCGKARYRHVSHESTARGSRV